MIDFRMPSLGADMEAGTLVEWLVKPGDKVKRGDVVAVVETQKGAIEIETFNAGVMHELVASLGDRHATWLSPTLSGKLGWPSSCGR